jgi:hypothetical protein
MKHEISSTEKGDDSYELSCICGWGSVVNQKFIKSISERHLNLFLEKGNIK